MKILGKGHNGIVVADGDDAVKKFYTAEKEWEREKTHLQFLLEIQKRGFDIGCRIPRVFKSIEDHEWKIQGNVYGFCNTMERIHGVPAHISHKKADGVDIKILGVNLGTLLFSMHTQSQPFISDWTRDFGEKDGLLLHIFNDKAGKVLKEETDKDIKKCVKGALTYLGEKKALFDSERTLSHLDLNLTNILVDAKGTIEGLVDWGSFGFTHPTISLYSLATQSDLWSHIKKQYEQLGGVIADDLLYAAATIHLAWAPLICRELKLELDDHENREKFEEMYVCFERSKA